MKLLVLTSEPITAQQLREALPRDVDPERVEVRVIAPAYQESALDFWMSDADEAIAKAEAVRRASVDQLGSAGVAASGRTGESDPLDAIQDALQSFAAERIVLFTHPEAEQRYREDVDVEAIEQRFGLPVDQAPISA